MRFVPARLFRAVINFNIEQLGGRKAAVSHVLAADSIPSTLHRHAASPRCTDTLHRHACTTPETSVELSASPRSFILFVRLNNSDSISMTSSVCSGTTTTDGEAATALRVPVSTLFSLFRARPVQVLVQSRCRLWIQLFGL